MSVTQAKLDVPSDTRSDLEKLNNGLLILGVKREMAEPEYQVLGRQTFTHHAIQSQHTYSSEVVRVLGELKLTAGLLSEVTASKDIGNIHYEPEELIAYYSGVFFDLVHQLKDKLFQLVAAMTINLDEPLKTKYHDLSSEQMKKFLTANKEKLTELGIYELLSVWREEDGPIGITLCRRTQHHHFRSRVQLNHDFQQLKMSRIMLGAGVSEHLTEYGRQHMVEIGEDAFKNLKDGTVDKQQKTIEAIEQNLNETAARLTYYYKVPTDQLGLAKIGAEYTNYLGSLRVPDNEASRDKIPPEIRTQIDKVVELAKSLGDSVVSIYLVGSVGRGELVAGASDTNFYIIMKNYSQSFDSELPVTLIAIDEKEFLSDKHLKDRFICWSDGVLLYGKEFIFQDKDFPKPGTMLAMLLNRDALDQVEALKAEVVALKNPSPLQLRLYSIKLARIILDFVFGLAMANKPYYTASRRKKLDYVKEAFPSDSLILTMEQAYYKGIIKQTDFPLIVDAFLGNARKSYDKMLKLEQEIKEGEEKA